MLNLKNLHVAHSGRCAIKNGFWWHPPDWKTSLEKNNHIKLEYDFKQKTTENYKQRFR